MNETVAAAPSVSLRDLCLQGGWTMIPLALLLLLCIYVFIDRFIALTKATQEDENFMKRIRGYIHEGETESALNLLRLPTPRMHALLPKAYRVSAVL